jgi:hypothetical protein
LDPDGSLKLSSSLWRVYASGKASPVESVLEALLQRHALRERLWDVAVVWRECVAVIVNERWHFNYFGIELLGRIGRS